MNIFKLYFYIFELKLEYFNIGIQIKVNFESVL